MADVGGITLYKILEAPQDALEHWSRLKLSFFSPEYASIFTQIARYYNTHSALPSFAELELLVRNPTVKGNISALKELDVPDEVSLDLAIEALLNEYTQQEALTKLDQFLGSITLMDTMEIKENLSNIVMYLEEKTHTSEQVCTVSDVPLFDTEDLKNKILLGLNNTFDANSGGFSITELIMLGGYRGSGKSTVCANIAARQHESGAPSVYFTIEMRKKEVFDRIFSILADVDNSRLRKGQSTPEELVKLAKARASFYTDAGGLLEEFISRGEYTTAAFAELDKKLSSQCTQSHNQIVVIDNQHLSLADIDLNLQKLKAKYGTDLKVAIVDYVNQIEVEDMYNWKSQIELSKGLKNLARKYDMLIVAPYQVDATGEARFAKGLLDAADVAAILEAGDKYIKFTSTKVRNMKPFTFASETNWESLKIMATDANVDEKNTDKKEDTKSKAQPTKGGEGDDLLF